MKMLRKIARISSYTLLAIAGIILFSVSYLMLFKFSNKSDLTPSNKIPFSIAVYPKNIVSDLTYSVLWGEKSKELRSLLNNLDSLKGTDFPDLGIDPTKPMFFFSDHFQEQDISGQIFSLNNIKKFEKNAKSELPKAFWHIKGNSVCILQSEGLSLNQLKSYFDSQKWESKKIKGKESIHFQYASSQQERLDIMLTWNKNRLVLDGHLTTKENYHFDKKTPEYDLEFAADKNGKANPILALFTDKISALKHNYNGLFIEVNNGNPSVAPIGDLYFQMKVYDSTLAKWKHPKYEEKLDENNGIIWAKTNEKNINNLGKPLHIQLTGPQLLKFDGNTMIMGMLGMSTVVGDLMEIISNMDKITIEGTMTKPNVMKIKGNIHYNMESDLLADLLLYIGNNSSKINAFSDAINPQNKK